MIPNKALSQVVVDRKSGKKPPKKVETVEEFLKRGGKVQKIKDKTGKKK